MLTKSVSFAMLGGDSLSATLISRTLYAHHLNVDNSRFLGGEYGQLPGPFEVSNLLRAKSFGEYVDLLDRNNVTTSAASNHGVGANETKHVEYESHTFENEIDEKAKLYEALLQATTLGQSSIAVGLLLIGADPNFGLHGGRIGKISGRIEQRATFKSNPLHLACSKGDVYLTKVLLDHKASYRSPNTNGLFPLHLAASSLDGDECSRDEGLRRLECVKLLLDAGCPLLMRDANKQSILHAAARAGHSAIIEFCVEKYHATHGMTENGLIPPSHFMNWYDKWFRTPVHWAVLNGRVHALEILLDKGCNPSPTQPKTNKYSSMVSETPLEICDRLYEASAKGLEMKRLLTQAINRRL
jgi:ankyrin repeat protein